MSMPVTVETDDVRSPPTPVVSVHPVVLSAPGRGDALQVGVRAPATGQALPLIPFSHGFGLSLSDYAPLADFWAAHGFVVIQPTHLDAQTLPLSPDDPRAPLIWRFRVEDLTRILDQLDLVVASVPGLGGRLDRGRIAVAGHSWGGQTASMLLGARVLDPAGGPSEDMPDARITAGVLLATPGRGGADLAPFAAASFPFMHPDFAHMTAPALVIAGDRDQSPLSVRGPDWFTDPYVLSPGDKSLLTLYGAEHSLGGITGYNRTDTTDENPARVALLQRLTWACLRSALGVDAASWPASRDALARDAGPLGRLQSK